MIEVRPFRFRRLAILAVLVVLGTFFLSRGRCLEYWANWLDVAERPQPADYAIVLGGGADSRPFAAATLWKNGYVQGVLVVNTRLSAESQDGIWPAEADLVRSVLRRRGVPDEVMTVLSGEADSTFDEANALRKFLEAHPTATIAVITTTLHTRRARSVFRHVLGRDYASRVYFLGVPPDDFVTKDWWQSEDGVSFILSESAKAIYYSARH